MNFRIPGRFVLSLTLPLLFGSLTAAQERGEQVLKRVEDTLNAPKDRTATMEMQLIDKSGNVKHRVIEIYQKGDQKRLIRFLEPADVKGVGFLVLSDEEMWLYMPAFHKIRRIASHTKHEKFMGTDFTYDDLAETRYTEDYRAKVLSEDEQTVVLELSPKPGSDVQYSRLVMKVRKSNWVPERVEFYNKAGKLAKVLTNRKVERIGRYWTVTEMEMQDLLDQHRTLLTLREVKHDTGLKDSIFTKRYLRRSAR